MSYVQTDQPCDEDGQVKLSRHRKNRGHQDERE